MNTELDQNAALTRYMPLSKFIAFLCNGIHCSPACRFEDPWEGHTFFADTVPSSLSRENLVKLVNKARAWISISCWHYAAAESYAMWQIYSRSDDAVAVHTTVGRLKAAVMDFVMARRRKDSAPLAVITQVKYIRPGSKGTPFGQGDVLDICFDHNQLEADQDKRDWIGLMAGAFGVKFDAYEYEKEVRLLVLDESAPVTSKIMTAPVPESGDDLHIPITDLESFVTGVSVSPKAPDWFVSVLRELTPRFGIHPERIPVRKSALFTGPGRN